MGSINRFRKYKIVLFYGKLFSIIIICYNNNIIIICFIIANSTTSTLLLRLYACMHAILFSLNQWLTSSLKGTRGLLSSLASCYRCDIISSAEKPMVLMFYNCISFAKSMIKHHNLYTVATACLIIPLSFWSRLWFTWRSDNYIAIYYPIRLAACVVLRTNAVPWVRMLGGTRTRCIWRLRLVVLAIIRL